MRPALVWLIMSTAVFAAWIGYLAYLVCDLEQRPKEVLDGKTLPVVLSRPQFLIADLVVIAEVKPGEEQRNQAQVIEVVWSRIGDAKQWKGKTIRIDNLGESKKHSEEGEYIIPLVNGKEPFRVAAIPPSPGYQPAPDARSPIYPRKNYTREQLEQILKELQPR